MSGRKSRSKGLRGERAIVNMLQERGRAAERVPLSGAAGGRYTGDISVPVLGVDRVMEVKVRANGFKEIYGWLADNYALVVKADRKRPLLVIPLDLAVDVLDVAEGKRT
jgi:Holliday junction resolvase